MPTEKMVENIKCAVPDEADSVELSVEDRQFLMDEMMNEIGETLAQNNKRMPKAKGRKNLVRAAYRPESVCDGAKILPGKSGGNIQPEPTGDNDDAPELPDEDKQLIMDEMMDEIGETLAQNNKNKRAKPRKKLVRAPVRPISVCDVGKSKPVKNELPLRPTTSFNELQTGYLMTTNYESFGVSPPPGVDADEALPLSRLEVPRFLTGQQLGRFHSFRTHERFGRVPHWRRALEQPSTAPAALCTSELVSQTNKWLKLYSELYRETI